MPRSQTAIPVIMPMLGGAVAAAAGVMLLGWPHRPPLPGQAGAVAAVSLVVVATLLVFAPAAAPRRVPSDVATERTGAERLPVGTGGTQTLWALLGISHWLSRS